MAKVTSSCWLYALHPLIWFGLRPTCSSSFEFGCIQTPLPFLISWCTKPGTPWNEIDLSESFLFTDKTKLHRKQTGLFSRRRLFFLVGGLLGAFLGWWVFFPSSQIFGQASHVWLSRFCFGIQCNRLFTEGPASFADRAFLDFDFDFDQTISSLLPQLNLSDVFSSATNKSWLKNHDFTVRSQMRSAKRAHFDTLAQYHYDFCRR